MVLINVVKEGNTAFAADEDGGSVPVGSLGYPGKLTTGMASAVATSFSTYSEISIYSMMSYHHYLVYGLEWRHQCTDEVIGIWEVA
jgi:hypothetical protein